MLGLSLPFSAGKAEAAADDHFAPNAFVRIGSDGKIVLTMPYVEMGQGTYTAIPMLIAEELEVDLQQVTLEHAPPDEKLYVNPLLGVQATGNSNAIRGAWQPLRQAGATARTMLVAAAAKRWNVDPATCRARTRRSGSRADRATHRLWRACRRCGPDAGACKRRAQATAGFQADRHPGQASGYAGEGQWNGRLRHRRPAARREGRDPCAIAGVRWPREKRRRCGGQGRQGRAPDRSARRRRRRGGRPHGRRQEGPRSSGDRMGRRAARRAYHRSDRGGA